MSCSNVYFRDWVLVLAVVIGSCVGGRDWSSCHVHCATLKCHTIATIANFETICLMYISQDRLHHNYETLPFTCTRTELPSSRHRKRPCLADDDLTSPREENNHTAQSAQDAVFTAGRWKSAVLQEESQQRWAGHWHH